MPDTISSGIPLRQAGAPAIRVRAATRTDLPVLRRMARAFQACEGVACSFPLRPWPWIPGRNSWDDCLVACAGDNIIGMITCEPPCRWLTGEYNFPEDAVFISALFVYARHRNRGAGRALISAAASHAITLGYNKLSLAVLNTGARRQL